MKKKILLVEYSSSTIDTIKQLLHFDVFAITVAYTEEEAARLLENEKFDMLITETLLPKSHGFILCKHVAEKYPETRIIIISEKLKKTDYKIEAITKYGADDFFEKPLDRKTFLQKVYQLLEVDEDEVEDEPGMTTNIHVIPLLEEIESGSGKKKGDDIFGKILKDVEKKRSYEIDLD